MEERVTVAPGKPLPEPSIHIDVLMDTYTSIDMTQWIASMEELEGFITNRHSYNLLNPWKDSMAHPTRTCPRLIQESEPSPLSTSRDATAFNTLPPVAHWTAQNT